MKMTPSSLQECRNPKKRKRACNFRCALKFTSVLVKRFREMTLSENDDSNLPFKKRKLSENLWSLSPDGNELAVIQQSLKDLKSHPNEDGTSEKKVIFFEAKSMSEVKETTYLSPRYSYADKTYPKTKCVRSEKSPLCSSRNGCLSLKEEKFLVKDMFVESFVETVIYKKVVHSKEPQYVRPSNSKLLEAALMKILTKEHESEILSFSSKIYSLAKNSKDKNKLLQEFRPLDIASNVSTFRAKNQDASHQSNTQDARSIQTLKISRSETTAEKSPNSHKSAEEHKLFDQVNSTDAGFKVSLTTSKGESEGKYEVPPRSSILAQTLKTCISRFQSSFSGSKHSNSSKHKLKKHSKDFKLTTSLKENCKPLSKSLNRIFENQLLFVYPRRRGSFQNIEFVVKRFSELGKVLSIQDHWVQPKGSPNAFPSAWAGASVTYKSKEGYISALKACSVSHSSVLGVSLVDHLSRISRLESAWSSMFPDKKKGSAIVVKGIGVRSLDKMRRELSKYGQISYIHWTSVDKVFDECEVTYRSTVSAVAAALDLDGGSFVRTQRMTARIRVSAKELFIHRRMCETFE